MKNIAILIFILTVNSAPIAFAQSSPPKEQVEKLLGSLAADNIELAFDAFAKDSLIPKEITDSVASQARSVITAERSVLGFEFLQEQDAGESVKRLTYVLKLSDRPLFWNFSFYKPTNDWVPLRIYFFEEP